MSFYKEVPGRKTTLESTLKFDTTPTAGSTNPVTSGGVVNAITEAVGGASDALQDQIDDIAEKAGSGYTPKGPASVATLNGLTGQENGWLYTMTDAGTLTDGSLAVTTGDSVAWDEANSVWYKAMDYATKASVEALDYKVNSYNTSDEWSDAPSGIGKIIYLPSNVPAGCEISLKWESEVGISVNIFLKYADGTQKQVNIINGETKVLVLEKELNRIDYVPYGYPTGVTTATFTGYFNVIAHDEKIANLEVFENKVNYSIYSYDYGKSFYGATASANNINIDGVIPAGTILVYGWKSETDAKCVVRLIYTDGSTYQLPTAENGADYQITLSRDIVGLRFTPYSFPTGVTQIDFDAIFKTEGSTDVIMGQKEYGKQSTYNASNKPIVCFVFDDGNAEDAKVVAWMKPLKLVSTFALIGNVDPNDSLWKSTISRYKNYEKNGHDIICHGITGGVEVDNIYNTSAVGLGYMNDADSYKVLRTEKQALKLAGFKTDALCYFNSTRYSPHVLNIVSGEFDFAIGSQAQNNSGVNTPDVTPIALSRNSLDSAGQANVIRGLIDANIGKRVLIIVGTHASSFGGTGKETEANVKSLFAYVAELRDKGLILNMGFHDAVATFYGNRNKILLPKESVLEPDVGQMVINSGSTEICTSTGVKAVFKIEVGGSVSAGSFRVNLKNNRAADSTYTEVTLDGTETIEDVVDILCSKNSYQEATVIKESSSEIIVRFDIPKVSSITFSDNTANLTLTATEITEGVAPTFA